MNTEGVARVEGISSPFRENLFALLLVVFFAGFIADCGRRNGLEQTSGDCLVKRVPLLYGWPARVGGSL